MAEPAGRLGRCAFLWLALSYDSFPIPSLFLSSRSHQPYQGAPQGR